MYQILESEQTMSGKWQVRVAIDADTSTFLSFASEPTQAQVDVEAEAFALNKRLATLRDTPLVEVQAEPVSTRLTKLTYMNRFTETELANIYSAAKSVVQVEVWLEKFKLSEFIDLADPLTIGGLQSLEAAGLIGVGRAAEIAGATL